MYNVADLGTLGGSYSQALGITPPVGWSGFPSPLADGLTPR